MQSKRILLVDDEPGLLEVCSEGLGEEGFTVLTAGNGDEALRVLEHQPIDLVVSDMKMPGCGGMDLLKAMRQRRLGVPVIVLTGYGTIENAVESLQQGAADYLLKPFDFPMLIRKIEKVFEEHRLKRYDAEVDDLLQILSLERELSSELDEPGLLKKFLHHVKKTFKPGSMAFYVPDGQGMESFFSLGPFFKQPGALAWFGRLAGTVADTAQPRLIDPLAEGESSISDTAGLAGLSAMAAPLHVLAEKPGVLVVVRDSLGDTGAFGLNDLQLFSIFAAHAASAAGYHRSCRRIQRMNVEFVTSYVQAVEAKDRYTKGHSERVRDYCLRLGEALGLEPEALEDLGAAALLHDIGKIGIPDEILNKPASLSSDEQHIMRRHPAIARDILSGVQSLQAILPVIYHHHERYDGRGYPDGLQGEDIPWLARIIQVADGFEAMTSNRAYQRARAPRQAMAILEEGAGTQWDPQVVRVWKQILERDAPVQVLQAPARAV